ncbi:M13 family metallopeptidase [Companilactobacillus sp.]|jgi:putative endopeptidase|uniref:M13 family metallopeptidase n=1 Tax=Companilactobacillus sp. TaxID=2767905 RepID=UPI0025C46B48|nr:M13 family metallopeptidase [Companilactobacillus sp.]MCH4009062.1 M13 family metallopeptidase [Companilactobacillus sp.]MCH4050759.1 M13 family metallopeptidase [Companilactobacillus sp.]MCH4077004.1 M13 family metallopeptidase [Companilactobacillus sp.]MCH4125580.1 M13 family metallopeptidase [Companilactobacillus sp.]MCI1311289.1 M13 family metallopeptidase [Companilactobacillus sp.]
MKLRSTTFICGAVLTILLGIGIETQTAKADTTTLENTQQTIVETPNFPLTNDSDEKIDDAKHNDQYAGGNWNISLDEATPQNNYYLSVNKDAVESLNASVKSLSNSTGNDSTDEFPDTVDNPDDTETTNVDDSSATDSIDNGDPNTQIMQGLDNISSGKEEADSIQMQQAADYYQRVIDLLNDDNPDYSSFQSDIEQLENISNYQDLSKQLWTLVKKGYSLPISISWLVNSLNHLDHVVSFDQSSIMSHLPNLGLDQEDSEARTDFISQNVKFLEQLGYSTEKANQMVTNSLNFNQLLNDAAISTDTQEYQFEQDSKPDFMDLDVFYRQTGNLDLKEYIQTAYPTATKIQIKNKKLLTRLSSIFNQANFAAMKDWMVVSKVYSESYLLGSVSSTMALPNDATQDVKDSFIKAMAFSTTESYFADTLSRYYGQKNVDDETIDQVTGIADDIINTYKERFQNNTWLSEDGKQQVLNKLSNMKLYVGYPKVIPADTDYSGIDFSQFDNVYDLENAMDEHSTETDANQFNEPNDFSAWPEPSFTMNAYYIPESNSFYIFGGIITDPYFSKDNTDVQNYGGIGVVIGHEISHAFDKNGTNYQSNGDFGNIWNTQDQAEFDKLADKMVKEYDRIPLLGQQIDGQQTLSENMADNGGLNVALEAAKKLPDFDADAFFSNWASEFAQPVVPEVYSQPSKDEHTVGPLRVNVGIQNISDFYTTYNVKKGDGMWLDPDKRVNIW